MKSKHVIWIRMTALCVAFACTVGWADGLTVSEARLERVKGGVQMIRVDLHWENSWRNDLPGKDKCEPNNYDAAWVFVKYRAGDGPWQHATLSTKATDHKVPADTALSVGQTDAPSTSLGTGPSTSLGTGKGMGLFLYRRTNGMGPFTANNVGLCWQRAANGLDDGAPVTVKVFALEMVYMPQGAFWLGDGLNDDAQFYAGGGGTNPFNITSEAEITIGPATGNLYSGKPTKWSGDQAGVLPVTFPKGYAAFYAMKHELSQGEYADYLSTLTPKQVSLRWDTWWKPIPSGPWGPDARKCGISMKADGTYTSTMPLKAAGFLRYPDMAAYLDWAGLRPMTELEFEKACRGPLMPVAGEFAWGDTKYVPVEGLENEGTPAERPTNYQKANLASSKCVLMRAGCLGIGSGSRHLMGASYYGMTELSGNQLESIISAGSAKGREFTGLHGDGALTDNGDADVPNWPRLDGVGFGIRGGGGGWAGSISGARISDRGGAAAGGSPDSDGHYLYGVRGIRTAP